MKPLFCILLFLPLLLLGQEWTFEEDFAYGSLPHGVVVTPDGKIWVGYFNSTDTLTAANGTEIPVKPIWIYNPDGSVHHIIYTLSMSSEPDTLTDGCRGVSLDQNGNVLYTEWYRLWRINYQTYEAMDLLIPEEGVSLTEAACDENGFIYLTHVVPDGRPFYIYDSDFNFVGFVEESLFSVHRSLVVTPDGKDIYLGKIYGDNGNGIIHYHSDTGPSGDYDMVDIYQPQIWGQCLDWGADGFLYVGSYWNVGPDDLDGWYALDTEDNCSIVASFGYNAGAPGDDPPEGSGFHSPRGAAWNEDGSMMFTADFDGSVIKTWLPGEPIPLHLRYDLWARDLDTGIHTKVTSIPFAGEYNPSWSPQDIYIAHDVVSDDLPFGQSIYITDIRFLESRPLEGAEGGNDPAWSPDGKWIAFDRFTIDDPSIYIVPAEGGEPQLVVADAIDPCWDPLSRKLVFHRPSEGTIRTIDKDGRNETFVTYGFEPVWSPKGGFIAFNDFGDIYKIDVNPIGEPMDQPVQLTFSPAWDGRPTCSKAGRTIAFHSGRSGYFDIWGVSSNGGQPFLLARNPEYGDYDPAFSKLLFHIAYSGFEYYETTAKFSETLPKELIPIPKSLMLEQNFPNPFNPTTTIQFILPASEYVQLEIYDGLGQKIGKLIEGWISEGVHQVIWNGKDSNGKPVASGIYYYKLKAGDQVRVKKMHLIR